MKRYDVISYRNNFKCLLKSYPFKIQAIIYCYLNGFVSFCGRYGNCLQDDIKINEVEYD